MTDSNLVQLSCVEETVWGTTPTTPQMKLLRYTEEDFSYAITTTQSAEIITDRQITDLIQTGARNTGGYSFELSFREHDEIIASQLMSNWVLTPEKDNAGTADSIITDIGTTTDTFAVNAGGTAFVAGHLARSTGATNAANNKIFRVGSSSTTTVVGASLSLTPETAPPGTARLKVVGFQGSSGDITVTSTGLGSTLLNFTTLGLHPGQWIKIGGSGSTEKFTTTANNDWVRVVSLSANVVTCDNLPTGWTAEAGGSKVIKVWFGDQISNGVTKRSWTFEAGFLGQIVPYYLIFTGMTVNGMTMDVSPGSPVSGKFTMLGKSVATATTVPLDSTPTSPYTADIINAVSNVGRIAEGGVTVTGPNYIQQMSIDLSNNLRDQTAVGILGLVGVGVGGFNATGKITTYFGDATIYNKIVNNTSTSVSVRFEKNGQAYIMQLPRVKITGGTPQAGGSNQDVVIAADFTAIKDTVLTNKTIIFDRLEYYE